MSQPNNLWRFDCVTRKDGDALVRNDRSGQYCLYSDYAALAAEYVELKDLYLKCRIDIGNLHKENERLKQPWVKILTESETWKALSEVARLTAENERLRKAGDAMAKSLAFEYPNSPKVAAWFAAKESVDKPTA